MDVQGNAAFLLREGHSDHEVVQFLMQYLMFIEEQAQPMLVYLEPIRITIQDMDLHEG